MELKDVLHFFLGCEVMGDYDGPSKGILTGIMNGGAECEIQFYLEGGWHTEESPEWNDTQDVKPILRPLSSLTKAEMEECGNLVYDFSDDPDLNTWRWQDFETAHAHEQTIWLLQRGFDLFNLIPEGKAIDATTLTQQQ